MRAVGATSSRSATSRSSAYMFTWTRTTPGPIPLVTPGSTEGSERETGLEASMNTQIETDVLIVGSGPAGGSAALFLSTYGVKNVVLTKYRWTANTPRAHITNQRTMEILRDMGVEAEVVEKSSPQELMSNNVFCTSLVGEELGRLRAWGTHPSRMADYTLASPSRICDCPQTLMEPILLSHAAARGSRVRFDTEYLSLEQDADGVTATVRDRIGGGTYQIRAKYLLGADGARSLVARDIALPMVGQIDVAGSINILVSADLAKYVAYRPGVLYWVLQTYNDERAPVGKQIVERANKSIAETGLIYDALLGPSETRNIRQMRTSMEARKENAPSSAEQREKLRKAIEHKNYEFNCHGVELNQHYRSTAVVSDGTPEPAHTRDPELYYQPTTWPGARLPHCWLLYAGRTVSTLDLAGKGRFTLFTGIGGEALQEAAAEVSVRTGVEIACFVS